MATSKVIYTGHLRTEAVHLASGSKIITDAPIDNHGKGEAFSPTDLMATSLANCMLTVMGIAANTHSINMDGAMAEVTKVMAANPRRVSEIHVKITMPVIKYTNKEKSILEHAGRTCPVAQSLHPNIVQDIVFIYS
ncbi:MAG TPA: OsmC family protein [Bacteroidia bacterium]|jgi:putative redox protein|nr:OsmC family protein [Bacteroidia bacterium]